MKTTAIRLPTETIEKAKRFASQACGRKIGGKEALVICANSLDTGVLDRVLDNVTAQAQEWVSGKLRDRDRMWTSLMIQFAARETGVAWKLSQKNGRLWLHREGAAASTGEELASVNIEELVSELRAGGAVDETPELN